jgi:uncharacterized protein (DUF934 family)
MSLIKDGHYVDDAWERIGGEAPLPAEGDIIIDFDRLREIGPQLPKRAGLIGVQVANTVDVTELATWLDQLALIALEFPSFNDGRAFSQGRTLRHIMGFKGELRASGKPMADQAPFLIRCGFTSFEAAPRQPLEVWQRATASVQRVYQAGYSRGAGATRE